jgi:hypothetical protein
MLEPVLIYTDDAKIVFTNAALANLVPYVQNVYNQLNELGVAMAIGDLPGIVNDAKINGDAFTQYCKTSYLAQAEFDALNALNLSAKKLDSIVDYPDFDSVRYWIIKTAIPALPQTLTEAVPYLQIVADVVSVKASAAADITALYTYLTANDKGAELATKIIDYLDTYNTNAQAFQDYVGQPSETISQYFPFQPKYVGVAANGLKEFYHFIRAQEAAYPDYIAA